MIRYHFDLYPRDDPRDGALLVRFTKLQTAEYRAEANGTGAGKFTIRGDTTDAGFIDPAGLQYVRVVREDTVEVTEEVIGGFFLDSGDFMALDEKGTRLLTFGGAGTLSYLAREVLWSRSYFYAADVPIIDSTWHFYNQPSILGGDFLGAVLYRVMQEAGSFASPVVELDDKPETAIPDATTGPSMGAFNDSAGNAWTVPSGQFKAQIGDNILSIVKRLMEAGLYIEMNPDTFVLNAWEQVAWPAHTTDSRGQDKSGAAWGLVGGVGTTYIVRFQAPTDGTIATGNVLSDAKRAVAPFTPRSAILAGDNGTYVVESVASDVPWHGFYPNDSQDTDTLSHAAVSQIGARSDAGDTLRLRMKHGTDAANGEYLPLSDYDQAGIEPSGVVMLNDLVTVHTGTGQWDYNEDTFPVSALTVILRPGGDWDAWADLGSSYTSMAERAFQAKVGSGGCECVSTRLCRDTVDWQQTTSHTSGEPLSLGFDGTVLTVSAPFDSTGSVTRWADVWAGGTALPAEMLWRVLMHWDEDVDLWDLVLSMDGPPDPAGSSDWVNLGFNVNSDNFTAALVTSEGGADSAIIAATPGDDNEFEYFVRVRIESGAVRARIWDVGDAEPGTWTLEDAVTDESALDGTLESVGVALLGVSNDGTSAANFEVTQLEPVVSCIHGGPAATSGDASVTCGKTAAPCNHEHDYVAAGGTTGQVLKKASDTDWDTEWEDESGGGGDVATDTIWDAAGDIAVGSGADTAARLALGAAGGALSRVNGVVAWNSGTGFPTAATGDRFWRTDRGLEYFYDGTRWLTTTLFHSPPGLATPFSANGSVAYWPLWKPTYDTYLESIRGVTQVVTTNDGTKYWTVALNKWSDGSVIGSFTTAADTANVDADHSVSIGAVSTEKAVYLALVKTSTPGNIYPLLSLVYRLVG